jgi:hypothetical protein
VTARPRPVVDLDDGLIEDLIRVEELLLTLRRWADEAEDGWMPPGPLAGDTALEAVRRLYDALRPTQSRHQYDHAARQQRDIAPAGPRWYAADGRYELATISFADVDDADVAQLAAAAGELGRPSG